MKRNKDENDYEIEDEATLSADEMELEDVEEMSESKLKKLREELKACQKEKQEYLDGWQREKADILNIKKRHAEDIEKQKERTAASHIEKLLPLCDSFRMAMTDESWEQLDEKWRQGVEQIHNQLNSLLGEYQVTVVGTEGEEFDPHFHEAVTNASVADKKQHHKIISVLQHGYVMNNHLIRPAKVVVGDYNETEDSK